MSAAECDKKYYFLFCDIEIVYQMVYNNYVYDFCADTVNLTRREQIICKCIKRKGSQ